MDLNLILLALALSLDVATKVGANIDYPHPFCNSCLKASLFKSVRCLFKVYRFSYEGH
jgi:hypothetical protein